LDPKWTLLGDVTWTGWSKIKQLVVTRDNGATLSTTPENFKDTWRVGIGATYRKDDAWSIKMGVAYDETPVNDTDRTARLPDNNRIWLSVGGQYRLSKDGTLDFGYSHLFIKDAPINQPAPGSGSLFSPGSSSETTKARSTSLARSSRTVSRGSSTPKGGSARPGERRIAHRAFP